MEEASKAGDAEADPGVQAEVGVARRIKEDAPGSQAETKRQIMNGSCGRRCSCFVPSYTC